jgi:hypothetical protein
MIDLQKVEGRLKRGFQGWKRVVRYLTWRISFCGLDRNHHRILKAEGGSRACSRPRSLALHDMSNKSDASGDCAWSSSSTQNANNWGKLVGTRWFSPLCSPNNANI